MCPGRTPVKAYSSTARSKVKMRKDLGWEIEEAILTTKLYETFRRNHFGEMFVTKPGGAWVFQR